MGKRKDKKGAAKKPRSILNIVDDLARAATAVQGIEDAARGAADLQGMDLDGVCTLLEMLEDQIRQLSTDLQEHVKAA